MGRKLRTPEVGVFPGGQPERRYFERDRVIARALARRAGLPAPEERNNIYQNLGNPEMPVFNEKAKIQKMVRDNPISILTGPTGSGKTSELMLYALEMGYEKIIYLENRILVADNIADYGQYNLANQVGVEESEQLIGVRHSERSTGQGKTIEVMTPDTFLRVFSELDEYADRPVLVAGDEIHEKDFSTDVATAVVAQQLEQRPSWRLVLMSATPDLERVKEAYAGSIGREIPHIAAKGRPYDMEIIERPDLTLSGAYETFRDNHKKALLFTAGKAEIKDTMAELKSIGGGQLIVTPLHAKLPQKDIKRATHFQLREGEKQAIPSTNAGQSGITIPGLTLVISDGTTRRPDIDQDGVEGLFKEYCALDEITQQAGRAGRDVEGGLMVLVSPDDDSKDFIPLNKREKFAPAQIHHTNISSNVLAVSALGYNFYDLNLKWLRNNVEPRRVLDAFDVLYRLGALDEHNNITKMGREMNRFPTRPEFSRAIVQARIEGAEVGRLRQLAAMISAVESGGLPMFEPGIGSEWRKDIRSDSTDDYAAQLDMFIATREVYKDRQVDENFLQAHNYDIQNVRRAHRTYDKICDRLGLNSYDVPEAPTPYHEKELHGYLAAGLFDYAHHRHRPTNTRQLGTYVSVHDGVGNTHNERTLSNRGVYRGDDKLVIGFPRRFEKLNKGILVAHSTIEHVFPTTLEKLSQAALWLASSVPQSPVMKGGMIKQRHLKMHGNLVLGEHSDSSSVLNHTPESIVLLKNAAFNKQTQSIVELTSIKRQLEWLARRIPNNEMGNYFPNGLLTDEWLQDKVEQAITRDVVSIYQLDNKLRQFVVRQNITIENWISEENIREIIERSPETISLGDERVYSIYYRNGTPIINGFNLRDSQYLPDEWRLEDGRQVLISYRLGEETKLYTASDIKRITSRE